MSGGITGGLLPSIMYPQGSVIPVDSMFDRTASRLNSFVEKIGRTKQQVREQTFVEHLRSDVKEWLSDALEFSRKKL
jgi:hypothetical protein